MIREGKKRKKYLGNRTRGAGNTKNRRGRGNKGGLGKVGRWKHKKDSFVDLIGAKIRLKVKSTQEIINLFDLNNYIETKILNKKLDANNIVLDFATNKDLKKYDKIVGKGNINFKVNLKNVICSKNVVEKVKAQGGAVE